MANNPLFSTYRGGENRVTSSMIAVFQRLELSLLERLLGAVAQESALQLVSFVNQPSGSGASVPDARISAQFDYWFETKTVPGALGKNLGKKQLSEHLESLARDAKHARLFIVTPDPEKPSVIDSLGDERVIWFNFRAMSDAIDEILDDATTFVGEQSRFLLRELQQLFIEDGLLDVDDVVVVAAGVFAWDEYNAHGVYICQPHRSFRLGLTHMGFYANGAIQRKIAKILYQPQQPVTFDDDSMKKLEAGDANEKRIANAIKVLLERGSRIAGQQYRVFVLSHPDDKETVTLEKAIMHTTEFAWTMGQRYTRLDALTKPGISTTTELKEAGG